MKVTIISMAVVALFAGCVTPSEKLAVQNQQREAIDRIPPAITTSAKAIIDQDTSALVALQAAQGAEASQASAYVLEIQQRLQKQEKMLTDFLTTAVDLAGPTVPGGQLVGNTIREFINASKTTSKEQSSAIKSLESFQEKGQAKIDNLATDTKRLEQQLSEKEREVKARLDEAVTGLKGDVLKLKDFDKDKFKSEFIAELERQGVSRADIEKAKGMTVEQLLTLLGVGGPVGAAGLFALKRTLGPSRSQPEVNELYDKVVALQAKQAEHEALVAQVRRSQGRQSEA